MEKFINIPLINGGNGNSEHPTQSLLDLYTIYKKFGTNFITKKILFIDDIKNSRTVHSLIKLINLYPKMKIYFLPFNGFEPDEKLLDEISKIHMQSNVDIVLNILNIQYNLYDIIYIGGVWT